MTGSKIESQALDTRRRRLLFRAWHRGIREMDLILGRFADAHIAQFTDTELDQFEQLIEVPDPELFAWVTGAASPPPGDDSAVFRRLRDFQGQQAKR